MFSTTLFLTLIHSDVRIKRVVYHLYLTSFK